jgi:hypothetical protein
MKISFYFIVWITAIILAASSAFYSVFGLSKLFSGAVIAIIIVASILESSKIVLATYIHDYWKTMSKILKLYMVFALTCLMIITSLGVYGFLTSAYQETIKEFKITESDVSKIDMKISSFKNQLDLLKDNEQRTITQIENLQKIKSNQDATVSTVYNSEKNKNTRLLERSMKSTNILFEKTTTELLSIQNKSSQILDSINVYETKKIELQTQNQISEIGPLLYISKALSIEMDSVVNYLVLLIMLVFDPLAVALVFAANSIKSKKNFDYMNKNIILNSSENTIENKEEKDNSFEEKIEQDEYNQKIENETDEHVESIESEFELDTNDINTSYENTLDKLNPTINDEDINIYGEPTRKINYSKMVNIK